MTIPEAYQLLGLDYNADAETLRKKAFELRKKYYLEKNNSAINQLDIATRVISACVEKKQHSTLFKTVNPEPHEYEFYEHMYDKPKSTIPFEQILQNEIILNNAKHQIRDYLVSLITGLDYIYDLDKLQQFINSSGLSSIISIERKTPDKRQK
ncbi:MAG: hypothetical protein V8Q75_00530 [Bacilli bacterium]